MTAAHRAARKAAGKCQETLSCTGKLKSECFCAKHLKARNKASRERHARDYEARKLSGRCVRWHCGNLQQETDLLCKECRAKAREYNRSENGRRLNAKHCRSRYKRRIREKICTVCGKEPLATKTLGEKCAAALNARTRSQKPYLKMCSECLEPGHNRKTCERVRRKPEPAMRIEDFIYSGVSSLGEAA